MIHVWWWLKSVTGVTNVNWYNWWSGFWGGVTVFGAFSIFVGLYKHHNCAVKGCPRIAHHSVKGTHYKTCHKHATVAHHAKLIKDHKHKFPKQHELLGKK